ncbi:hypothetical protein [Streptomyces sp. NPDC021212]|uniref:hypothetical protein n=1 Tax=Streptomyces sp. NPDC021212 TaxID=3365118 RepID=UPI00378B48B1
MARGQTQAPSVQVVVSDTLSQDVLLGEHLSVSPAAGRKLIAFHNPLRRDIPAQARHEALLLEGSQDNARLVHLAADPGHETGWRAHELFPEHAPREITVVEDKSIGVWCFFSSEGALWCSRLKDGGVGWEPPEQLPDPLAAVEGWKVAYAPDQAPLLYGSCPDGIVLWHLDSPPSRDSATGVLPHNIGVGADVRATVTGLTEDGVNMLCFSREPNTQGVSAGPQLQVCHVTTGRRASSSQDDINLDPGVKEVIAAEVTEQGVFVLVLTEDGMLQNCVFALDGTLQRTVEVGKLPFRSDGVHVTGTTQTDASWDLFGIDDGGMLWSLREDRGRTRGTVGEPTWLPPLPLARDVVDMAVSHTADGGTALFSCGEGGGHLRLDEQDPRTGTWQGTEVRVPGARVAEEATLVGSATEVTRHRLQAQLTDDHGTPLAKRAVTLRTAETSAACRVTVGGRAMMLNPQPQHLETDVLGRITLSLPADGLAAPEILLETEGLAKPVSLQPGKSVHAYLAGSSETLNPTNPGGGLSPFDAEGRTLRAARVPRAGEQATRLVPAGASDQDLTSAAKAVRCAAAVGLGRPVPEGNAPAGFFFGTSDGDDTRSGKGTPSGATFEVLSDAEALARCAEGAEGSPGTYYGIFDGVGDWIKHRAGDALHSLKNGLSTLKHLVVDVGKKVARFAIRVGKTIVSGFEAAVHALDHAAHLVIAALRAVEVAVEDAIRWLRAFFDFSAIWNTKKALESAADRFLSQLADNARSAQQAADHWLKQHRGQMDRVLTQVREKCQGAPLTRPVHGAELHTGGGAVASVAGDIHHNWAMDKLQTYASGVTATSGKDHDESVVDHLRTLTADLERDLRSGVAEFARGMQGLLSGQGEDKTLGDLVEACRHFMDAAFEGAQRALDTVAALVDHGIEGLRAFLAQHVSVGPLNALWSWLAKAAGHPDDKLTVGGLLSLVAAVPVTLVYKLSNGVHTEPFPGGVLPGHAGRTLTADAASDSPDGDSSAPYPALLMCAGTLQAFSLLPAAVGDLLGEDTPVVVTGLGILCAVSIAGLSHAEGEWNEIQALGPRGVLEVVAIGAAVGGVVGTAFVRSSKLRSLVAEAAPWLLTLWGAGVTGYTCVKAVQGSFDDEPVVLAASLLCAVPSLTAFMNASLVRKTVPEVSIPLKVTADLLGNVLGGTCVTLSAKV